MLDANGEQTCTTDDGKSHSVKPVIHHDFEQASDSDFWIFHCMVSNSSVGASHCSDPDLDPQDMDDEQNLKPDGKRPVVTPHPFIAFCVQESGVSIANHGIFGCGSVKKKTTMTLTTP
jgi:hypothetical protein